MTFNKILTIIVFATFLFYACSSNDSDSVNESEKKTVKQTPTNEISDEIREIMHLTLLLQEVEKGVNDIYNEYDIIQLQTNSEYPITNDEQLLININLLKQLMRDHENQMLELRKKIDSLNTTNNETEKIKNSYMNIVKEKNIQITRLIEKTLELESEIKKRDLIIEENSEIINQQQYQITSQNTRIEKLSQKHAILYSRRKTFHYLLNSNTIFFNNKLSNVKLISVHPKGSYKLQATGKKTSKLSIYNPDKFWGESNYVIIKVRKI